MKKLLLILAIIAGTNAGSFAQTKESEAKAAYLLAEESYGKGDYKTALDFLQQVKAALGGSNCKILYLQIMVTKEIHAKNPKASEILLPLIAEFEQSPDIKDFNEEKTLEITKLKLAMKLEEKALKDKASKEQAVRDSADRLEQAIDKVLKRYPPLGLTADQLDAVRPELNVKKWRPVERFPEIVVPSFIYYDARRAGTAIGFLKKGADFKGQLALVEFNSYSGVKKSLSYSSILVYSDKETNPEGAAAALQEADAIIAQYSKELGKPRTGNNGLEHLTTYTWQTKKWQVVLNKWHNPNGSQPEVKLFEFVSRLSLD